MLNLLIISNSPKALLMQTFMQPLIKSKIDVVTDFDHGLKDVFEKRPAMVIIQEQIAGVGGESVARHIQLLLGSGAPAFIMMHEGNARIRPVKGLFEVVVDLDQPDEALVEDVLSALKRVIGDEWDKIAVPPSKPAPTRVVSAKVPDEARLAADKLVDEFLSDVQTSEKTSPELSAEFHVESTLDEIVSLMTDASRNTAPLTSLKADPATATDPVKRPGGAKRPLKDKPLKTSPSQTSAASDAAAAAIAESVAGGTDGDTESFDFPELDAVVPPAPPAPERSGVMAAARQAGAASAPNRLPGTAAPSPAPAEFRISASPAAPKVQPPEDILTAFDENYRSRPRLGMVLISALVVIAGVGGGWYLFAKKPNALLVWGRAKTVAPVVAPGAAAPAESKQPAAAPPVQNVATSAARPAPAPASSVPSFVPVNGRDSGFSARKPGWERYVDAAHDIRIYRASGRIKAIQVMALKGHVIQETFLQSALREVAGSSAYILRSRERKQGFVIQRCSVGPRSDLLVYRQQPSDTISAFVVSLE